MCEGGGGSVPVIPLPRSSTGLGMHLKMKAFSLAIKTTNILEEKYWV